MGPFVLHALHLGEGTLALSQMPGRAGDYRGDLAQVRDWKPSFVISMAPLTEMASVGALSFGNDLRDSGTRWAYLPTDDFGVLPVELEGEWARASASARAALAGGGRVLVHCMGGCGRSGMAALRLMVEMGEPPTEALQRLRRIRPCAVETPQQLDWALAGRAQVLPEPRPEGTWPIHRFPAPEVS